MTSPSTSTSVPFSGPSKPFSSSSFTQSGLTNKGQKVTPLLSNPSIDSSADADAKAATRKKWILIAILVTTVAILTVATSGIALFVFLGGLGAVSLAGALTGGLTVASLTVPNIMVAASALAVLTAAVVDTIAYFKLRQKEEEEEDDKPKVQTAAQMTQNWNEEGVRFGELQYFFLRTVEAENSQSLSNTDLVAYIDNMNVHNPLKNVLLKLIWRLQSTVNTEAAQRITQETYAEMNGAYKLGGGVGETANAWSNKKKMAFIDARNKLSGSIMTSMTCASVSDQYFWNVGLEELDQYLNTESLTGVHLALFKAVNEAAEGDLDGLNDELDQIVTQYNNHIKRAAEEKRRQQEECKKKVEDDDSLSSSSTNGPSSVQGKKADLPPTPQSIAMAWSEAKKKTFMDARNKLTGASKDFPLAKVCSERLPDTMTFLDTRLNPENFNHAHVLLFKRINETAEDDLSSIETDLDGIVNTFNEAEAARKKEEEERKKKVEGNPSSSSSGMTTVI